MKVKRCVFMYINISFSPIFNKQTYLLIDTPVSAFTFPTISLPLVAYSKPVSYSLDS